MAGARSKSKSTATPKSKKPPPKPNGNILSYFSKVPAANQSPKPSSGANAASPQSLKRKSDGGLDENEERRAKLTKALEDEFGTGDINQEEEDDDDDDLRSLFEDDGEDLSSSAPISLNTGETPTLPAKATSPPLDLAGPRSEAKTADCFMCGKVLSGLSESEANAHVNDCLDRAGTEMQKRAEHDEICEGQVIEAALNNKEKEVIVIDDEGHDIKPKMDTEESTGDAAFKLPHEEGEYFDDLDPANDPSDYEDEEEEEDLPNQANQLEEAEEEDPSRVEPLNSDDAPGTRVAPIAPMFLPRKPKPKPTAFTALMDHTAEKPKGRRKRRNQANPSEGGTPQAPPRPCPFYKKLFQGIITVDAFRYSKIEGCNAYFLSHFHSDHYMGLSSSWCHGPIYCSRATANLLKLRLRVKAQYIHELPWDTDITIPNCNGIKVRLLDANHCPGSALFLFTTLANRRVLHTGDFRATTSMIKHPSLFGRHIHELYLDTTYLSPKYSFPHTLDVLSACSGLISSLMAPKPGIANMLRAFRPSAPAPPRGHLLVLIGTYSIGKERLAVSIARAIGSKIHVPESKYPTYLALEDPLLTSLLTTNPHNAQVHLTPLGNISIQGLKEYLEPFLPTPRKPASFNRIVGIKPTGWTYTPPASRNTVNPTVREVLNSEDWESPYKREDMKPVRGSNDTVALYEVPYSEHSGFRDLTRFCCGLDIGKIIATVGVGGEKTRREMAAWMEKWKEDRKRFGLWREKAVREKEGPGTSFI
ncbi:DRMBL-domain-containing protein [Ascobolus immersus RN42]|uniref:DRMBL-domain-containing protein n=1 Tax=Ascobolus immersus RN42 TaxID=1160509 RepID=A0A3N4IIA2_ASCIM|nr:DRMBL-domain-containing protein [Ascobolus immersus RN42]